jgi:hypothetical protein
MATPTHADPSRDTAGRCLCGDVAFRAQLPSKWVAHCHCTLCQRSSGAAFVTWVGLHDAGVVIDDAHGRLAWYTSSATGERGFCRRCGSTLFFRSPRWPGELHVARANFDGPVDRLPQAHVFWDTHVDWIALADDGLPRKTAAQVA